EKTTATVQIINTYCEDSLGFGKVSFSSELPEGEVFQISGENISGEDVIYTFHVGEHKLPAGIYTWNATVLSGAEGQSSGEFVIDIKCGTTIEPKVEKEPPLTDLAPIDDGKSVEETPESVTPVFDEVVPLDDVSQKKEKGTSFPINVAEETPTVSEAHNVEQITGSSSGEFVIEDNSIIRSVLSGKHVLFLETKYADSVEWYIKRDSGDMHQYLGTAIFNRENLQWEYVWETTRVPNGDYILVPEINSSVGKKYKHTPSYITVKNKETEKTKTTSDNFLVDKAKEAFIITINDASKDKETGAKEDILEATENYYNRVQEHINSSKKTNFNKEEIEKEQKESREYLKRLIDIESSNLLGGVLEGDEERKNRVIRKITLASNNYLEKVDKTAREFGVELSDEEIELIRKEINNKTSEFKKVIEEKKEIFQGRVEQNVFEDSDKDGVSNYDEINIYNTDPLDVDSDNDGYTDGAEIVGGFNPSDSLVEAIIKYEEPTTSGYLEEEIFSINSIFVEEVEVNEKGKEKAKKIAFEGTAPANSFVTLYIYSTPIIVTVKTDKNGDWSYVLDKELEDGEHEIYVAIIDNAGKIFAKSNPLPFVKEAEAVGFSEGVLVEEDIKLSLFEGTHMFFVVLLIILIIGWAFIRSGALSHKKE
ncbi:MAG: hypothetical protein KAI72_00590, partial [Candidatus Pacebacteria bacterium]|nr:hypothetical protein [Candidatus Paceibacterota bacterium]